ncbi:calnexin-like isoform X2 [Huso huso]|uniref:Calnexin-like isoform X2 n=1 Tax=Huso huso TaxID=61971 RepID=A0ABR1A8T7_HUSHU
MKLLWLWMCLGLLCLAAVVRSHEEEDDDTEYEAQVEDFEEKPTETSDPEDNSQSFQVTYKTPVPTGKVNFAETFDDGSLDGWKISKTMKDDTADEIAKYDGERKWEVEPLKENTLPGDKGLVLKSRAKHHAIAAMLQEPFVFEEKPLVVQYEVNFQDGIDCGGAYMKLLSATDDLDLENFYDRTPYTIMFGPDKCGEDYKLHFIFRHKNPQNGDYEEKQAKRADVDLKKIYSDKKTHLYTLVLNPDNSFEIFIDQTSVSKGNLLEDFIPPVNPAKEVDDPNDSKPEDWDEHPKIPNPEETKPDDWDEDAPTKIEDPNAVKPEGWLDDEPEYMSDPNSEKPEDWDEEMDGEWEAPQVPNPACETAPGCGTWKLPMIDNPNYKGKWKPSMIDNPNYQGIWSPRKIPNPDYFEDQHPFLMTPFSAVGLELWSMTSDIYFDNFIICSEKEVADRWAADSWGLKKLVASANEPSVLSQLMTAAEERPWLWIVYILTVGLPLGLVVFFCFPKKTDELAATYKKTDAWQKDVKEAEEKEEEEEQEQEEKIRLERRVKEELAASAKEEEEEDEDEEEEEEDEESGAVGEGSHEEEEDEEGNKTNESVSEDEMKDADEGTGDGPKQPVRKRRVRKE